MKVLTGIFKEPVEGPVMVSPLNLAGDRQADLTVHGGVNKAIYAYPAEPVPRRHCSGVKTDIFLVVILSAAKDLLCLPEAS